MKDIERLLGVSRSSVSLWVRDIALTPEQIDELDRRSRRGSVRGAIRKAQIARARRAEFQQDGRRRAHNPDVGYAGGCMLFWAEGSRSRGRVVFTNSDPAMMRVFIAFLRTYFPVSDEKFRVACNLFADHAERQHAIEQYWLDTLQLPRTCLTKTIVNRYSRYSQKKRQNKLPHGTCRLTLHSTEVSQILHGSIQELGGFDRPEWLDL